MSGSFGIKPILYKLALNNFFVLLCRKTPQTQNDSLERQLIMYLMSLDITFAYLEFLGCFFKVPESLYFPSDDIHVFQATDQRSGV